MRFNQPTSHGATQRISVALAADPPDPEFNTRFAFLLTAGDDPAQRLPEDNQPAVLAFLDALGAAMVADPDVSGFSDVPPIFTYLGQFIDHDLTANTDRNELSSVSTPVILSRAEAVAIPNRRHPTLRMDSLYGHVSGAPDPLPLAGLLRAGPKMRVGTLYPVEGSLPAGGLNRDLPRFATLRAGGVLGPDDFPDVAGYKAFIGDPRNEENLLIGQLHCAFLRFHNAVVDWLNLHQPHLKGEALFLRARQLTTLHYQWVVLHEYLPAVGDLGVVSQTIEASAARYHARATALGEAFMPLEFSVAAFRFGHTMVRPTVNLNAAHDFISFRDNFVFTGHADPTSGDHVFTDTDNRLGSDRAVGWERLISTAYQTARPIDTRLAPPLADLVFGGEPAAIMRHLAVRNLRRSYVLSLPTGQAVAAELGIPVLTPDQVRGSLTVTSEGFDWTERTPLWFYILREAEVVGAGNRLGPVGTALVAETIVGAMATDYGSILHQGWTPLSGVTHADGRAVVTLRDMLQFAGVL